MHSLYTKRRGVEKSLCRQLLGNLDYQSISAAFHVLLRFVFTTWSPRVVNAHIPATLPKHLFLPSSATLVNVYLARLKGNQIESEQPFLFTVHGICYVLHHRVWQSQQKGRLALWQEWNMLWVSLTKMQKDTIINSLVCKLLIEVKQVLVKTLHILEVAIHCKLF